MTRNLYLALSVLTALFASEGLHFIADLYVGSIDLGPVATVGTLVGWAIGLSLLTMFLGANYRRFNPAKRER